MRNIAKFLLVVALTLTFSAILGCDAVPFLGGEEESPQVEMPVELSADDMAVQEDIETGTGIETSLDVGVADAADRPFAGAPTLLRVFQNEEGHIEALFDHPVKVESGEVKMSSDKGALSRKFDPRSDGYDNSLVFDINTVEEGGDVTVRAIFLLDGAAIRSEDGQDARTEFVPETFFVEPRLFAASVRSDRPYVRDIRAEEWSLRVLFSANVRFGENLRLLTRNVAGQTGEMPLAWESLNAMRSWSYVDSLLFAVPEPYRGEQFWIAPVQVYGFSPNDGIADAAEGGLPARRAFEPFVVELSRGAVLNDLQRCAYHLSEGDQMRYSFAVSNLSEFLEEDPRLEESLARSECLAAVSRAMTRGETGLLRNWKHSACIDALETSYRVMEFYPGDTGAGYPSQARDRWLRADELMAVPYDLLSLEERIELRDALAHESCPKFYPQLFYGYWVELD